MAPCGCGGFHLFKDCPDKSTAKKGKKPDKLASTGSDGPTQKVLAVTGDDGIGYDDDALYTSPFCCSV